VGDVESANGLIDTEGGLAKSGGGKVMTEGKRGKAFAKSSVRSKCCRTAKMRMGVAQGLKGRFVYKL